ncbi:MAG: polysaccharide pyruvyl transferase family protein [Rhodococcus sp. (in: high G+C Gram-positive bacteria)]
MTEPSRRIVFLGTHGQYNIGDELLLDTFLTQLGSQHHYVVNSYDPEFTRAQLAGRFTVDVIDTAGDRRRLLQELFRCDLLCFGGGSIIKELYASTGRNRYATLLMILAIVTFTHRIARKPITMLNVGVGPVRTPHGRRLARMILSQVDQVTVRDQKSFALCSSIGITPVRATDAVFSADAESLRGEPVRRSLPTEASPIRVALNLNFDIENPDNWEFFLERLAAALQRVHDRHSIELHALPMQAGFKEHDDAEVLDAFATRVPSITYVKHRLVSPADAARLIEGCDVLVSERLHAIVMASILGVPSFVLAYDVKVRELASMLGLVPWSVDINEPFDADDVGDRIIALIEQRETVAAEVGKHSSELGEEARRNFEIARRWVGSVG